MKHVIRPSYDLYINGRWVPSSDGSTFKAINPANGDVLSVCAEATQDDVNAAVRAAQAAFGVLLFSLRWQRKRLRSPGWAKALMASAQCALLRCPLPLRILSFSSLG